MEQQEARHVLGKPLEQFVSEMREKHNLPQEWGRVKRR